MILVRVLRSAFCVLRSAFCVLRSAFCVLRSAFCVLRSANYLCRIKMDGTAGGPFPSGGSGGILPRENIQRKMFLENLANFLVHRSVDACFPLPHFNDGKMGAFWFLRGFIIDSGVGVGEGGKFSFYSVQDCSLLEPYWGIWSLCRFYPYHHDLGPIFPSTALALG